MLFSLQTIGLYAFDSPPPVFLPLAAQAAMAIILGGLAKSRLLHRGMQRCFFYFLFYHGSPCS